MDSDLLTSQTKISRIFPFLFGYAKLGNENPDWKATCEAMNERTVAREKWFIKWFGE